MAKFKYLFVAVVATVCAMGFTACSSDDDGDGNDNKVEAKKTSEFTYQLTLNDDMLTVADVTVGYIDTEGVEKEETLSSSSWKKTFTADKFNVSSGVAISMKLKDGVTLDKEQYKLGYSLSYAISSMIDTNKIDTKASSFTEAAKGVKAENVPTYFEKGKKAVAFTVDGDGKVTTAELSWKNI